MHYPTRKGLRGMRIALLVLSCVSVCLNLATVVLHEVNALTNVIANSLCILTPADYYSTKFSSGTIQIAFVMTIIGLSFALFLVATIVVWMFVKNSSGTFWTQKYRTVCFSLSSLALIGTYTGFGYYMSYFLDSISCNPLGTDYLQIWAVWILSGSSTLLLLTTTILCLCLPKTPESKYEVVEEEKPKGEIQMTNPNHSQNDIKVSVNGNQIGSYRVHKPDRNPDQLLNTDGDTHMNDPLLVKPGSTVKQKEFINPVYGYQQDDEQDTIPQPPYANYQRPPSPKYVQPPPQYAQQVRQQKPRPPTFPKREPIYEGEGPRVNRQLEYLEDFKQLPRSSQQQYKRPQPQPKYPSKYEQPRIEQRYEPKQTKYESKYQPPQYNQDQLNQIPPYSKLEYYERGLPINSYNPNRYDDTPTVSPTPSPGRLRSANKQIYQRAEPQSKMSSIRKQLRSRYQ